tara:strand:+ start:143 stop:2278 length:2136 start_codon:yes stop_codon:yes gene_type:complete
MSENQRKFFSQTLWEYWDNTVTCNRLIVSLTFQKDPYTNGSTYLQFNLRNKSKFSGCSVMYKDLISYLKKYKECSYNLEELAKTMTSEQHAPKKFEVKFRNKTLTTSFLFKVEYNFCVQIIISDKTENFLDVEKIYISIDDYMSLIKLMHKVSEDYITLISNIPNIILLNEVKDSLNNLSEKITSYYAETKNTNTPSTRGMFKSFPEEKSESDCLVCGSVFRKTPNGIYCTNGHNAVNGKDITDELESKKEKKSEIKELDVNVFEAKKEQNELDDYVNNNVDKIDLEIDKVEKKMEVVSKKEIVETLNYDFTEKILKNDILNLERYIINLMSQPIPLQKFSELIVSKGNNELELNDLLFPECSKKDLSLIFYTNTLLVKYYLNSHLKNKEKLPLSIKPIIYNCKNPTKFNLSLMYDLFLYFIYYSQLRNLLREKTTNTIDNRELVCFALKTICSPLVFSFVSNKIDKNIFIYEVVSRYQKYCDSGVFSSLSKTLSIDNISIPIKVIEGNATKIYDGIIKKKNDLIVKNRILDLNKLGLTKLSSEDFLTHDLSYEQIIKVVSLDFQENSNNGIKDIPSSILQKYKIQPKQDDIKKKPVNENLIRFVQEFINKEIKNDKKSILTISMDICNSISTSYYDLEGKTFDYINLPESVLKAIKLWDPIIDKKITKDYVYFKTQIENSSLTKSMIISLLNNLNQRKNSDFVNSLKVVN